MCFQPLFSKIKIQLQIILLGFDGNSTKMNNYCEKRQPHILSLIYRLTDLIVENSFVENDQGRLSEFLPKFIDKQNSSLG